MLGIKLIEVVDRRFRGRELKDCRDYIRWRKKVRDRVLLNYDYNIVISNFYSIPGSHNVLLLDDIENQTAKALMSDIC